jgi:hypothetical protein
MVATAIDVNEILAACSKKERSLLFRALVAELIENDPRKAPMRFRDESGKIVAYLVPAGTKVQLPPIEDTPDYEAFLKKRAEDPSPDYTVAEVEAMLDAEFGPLPYDPEWEVFLKSQS